MDITNIIDSTRDFYEQSWEKLLWFITAISAIAVYILGYVVPKNQSRNYKKTEKRIEKKFSIKINNAEEKLRTEFNDLRIDLESQFLEKIKDLTESLAFQKTRNDYYAALNAGFTSREAKRYKNSLGFAKLAIEYAIQMKSVKKLINAVGLAMNKNLNKEDISNTWAENENMLKHFLKLTDMCNGNGEMLAEVNKYKNFIKEIIK